VVLVLGDTNDSPLLTQLYFKTLAWNASLVAIGKKTLKNGFSKKLNKYKITQ